MSLLFLVVCRHILLLLLWWRAWGYLAMILLSRSTFLTTCCMCGSTSVFLSLYAKTIDRHLLAELGPIVSAMAVLRACVALLDPLPTSVPYKAAGSMVVVMVVVLPAGLMGSHLSLLTFAVAFWILFVVVLAAFLLSMATWAPRSLKWVTTLSLVPSVSHVSFLSFCLVVGQVDVRKHLLLATLAPMSWKYVLDSFMPSVVLLAWFSLLADMYRSSASTLGVSWFALMCRIHGLISSAMRVMEMGILVVLNTCECEVCPVFRLFGCI